MKVSLRSIYGIMAVVDLAMHMGSGPIQAKAIARRQGMPARFLEQVLHALKKAGLVTSLRGAQGGYVLAKKPSEISLADVLEVLEGPFRPVSRFNGRLPQAAKAELLLAKVWDRVLAAERDILTSITVEELAEQQQQLEQQRSLMYHI